MVRAIYLTFGVVLGAIYLLLGVRLGLAGVLLIWLGVGMLVVGIAHTLDAPGLMGKRRDGTFHPLGLVLHLPYLGAAWWAWRQRSKRGEPPWHEVASGVFLGRMATFAELPPGNPRVVDLTSELFPPRAVREGAYVCLPTLDGNAPERVAFWALAEELAAHPGPIFIHCAAGRGRSATLAAAVLMKRGLAKDADDAVAQLKSKRSVVTMSESQRRRLRDGGAGRQLV